MPDDQPQKELSSLFDHVRRIEFRYGLALERSGGQWKFRDPSWIDGGPSWLALTPFDSLDEALSAAERVMPLIERAWDASSEKSRSRQAYYVEAMAATHGR